MYFNDIRINKYAYVGVGISVSFIINIMIDEIHQLDNTLELT